MSLPASVRALSTLAGVACLSLLSLLTARAHDAENGSIISRTQLSARQKFLIVESLSGITGWRGMQFDERGVLRLGVAHDGGSPTARELLTSAVSGDRLMVIEDAGGREDVVFCSVVPARWTGGGEGRPPAYVVLIDFKDFSYVTGDRDALAAFNVGWGLLHEISHVVNDSEDTDCEGAVGECEKTINRMRRECSLAERAEYHFKPYPGLERSEFKTRLVRLAFVRRDSANREKRLWLVWDAALVGGLRSEAGADLTAQRPPAPR